MLAGFSIAVFTLGQLLFMGLSVIFFGVLIHITAAMLLRSVMKPTIKQFFEVLLVLFIAFFFSFIIMDYLGIIKIPV